jgi:UDP:flavonoid glycosyltransferase YjiC (YdhE family)
MGADQPDNARRVVAIGAGLALDVMRCTPAEVGAAVERVRREPSFRRAAERMRDEIAALPGPEAAVARLEAIAG